jgi:cytidylate kinase
VIVAIDGPAASGKSTVARALAERLGLEYLDTGAMYRAIGVEALDRGIDLDDPDALTELACCVHIEFRHEGGSALPTGISIDGRDVTAEIRSPAADAAVSPVAIVAGVRAAMVDQQRRVAASKPSTVLEGRDIGTVVFPDAEVKVFLTASGEERARRRTMDMERRGVPMTQDEVRHRLEHRDLIDSTREASPLAQAPDAVVIDTTGMTVDEVVDAIARLIEAQR